MSDEDTDTDNNPEQGGAEAALDIELVSVEEAEAEAAEARLEVDPEQQQSQEELADEIDEVLKKVGVEPEDGADNVAEQTEENAPEEVENLRPSNLKGKARKVVEGDDFLEENDPVAVEVGEVGDDAFIAMDDNEIKSDEKEQKDSAAYIEGLTEMVVDAAAAANQAAHSSNQSIHMLLGSVTTINNMADAVRKTNRYVLGFIISLGVVGLLSGASMVFVLQSAVKDATAVSNSLGTKLVQFEKQMDRVNVLEVQITDVADVNHRLGQRLEQVMFHLKQLGTESQQAASQQAAENQLMLGSVNDQILTSFDDLQNTTKAQQKVLSQLKKRIDGLQLQMKTIQNQDLVGKMKALIALEQERYFELEKEKLAFMAAQVEAKKKAEAPPAEDSYITFGVESQ
jgi:Tat protein secretion system quality control protein TatD with DNase activity